MDLLQSSEKLVVIKIGSLRATYSKKIVDSLIDLNVVWHEWGSTAEEKEIALSIVYVL